MHSTYRNINTLKKKKDKGKRCTTPKRAIRQLGATVTADKVDFRTASATGNKEIMIKE